ncbi:MAG: hypothetical protein LBL31_03705 [Spirochaetaceae bacterium]|nr:hypothetical protein [Spirochaetaceae bacterium]
MPDAKRHAWIHGKGDGENLGAQGTGVEPALFGGHPHDGQEDTLKRAHLATDLGSRLLAVAVPGDEEAERRKLVFNCQCRGRGRRSGQRMEARYKERFEYMTKEKGTGKKKATVAITWRYTLLKNVAVSGARRFSPGKPIGVKALVEEVLNA